MRIVTNPERLSKVCEPVDYKTSRQIANKMIMFLLSHKNIGNNSIGLACNQLGLDGRILLIKQGNRWERIINPVILNRSDETIISEEKCLSIKKKSVKVERYTSIKIIQDLENIYHTDKIMNYKEMEFSGLDAIVIQHEIDHLNGILITDKE
jgi:peptide deformylase